MSDELEGYLDQVQKAEQYAGLLQEAIARLTEGDAAGFKELLSPNMIAASGEEQIDAVLASQLVPFFSGATDFGDDTTVATTSDRWGNNGLAFYKSVVYADGSERPFVIYVVEEGDHPVIANLLPGRTYKDMHAE